MAARAGTPSPAPPSRTAWPRCARPTPLHHYGAPKPATQVGIDVDTAPRQAGYIADDSSITGAPSPLPAALPA